MSFYKTFPCPGNKCCCKTPGDLCGHVPGFKVQSIDATGAGDAFLGAILFQILKLDKDLTDWTGEDLIRSVRFANATGALATTKKGAIPAMPSLDEIEQLLEEN